jgi:hypothetical protein
MLALTEFTRMLYKLPCYFFLFVSVCLRYFHLLLVLRLKLNSGLLSKHNN